MGKRTEELIEMMVKVQCKIEYYTQIAQQGEKINLSKYNELHREKQRISLMYINSQECF